MVPDVALARTFYGDVMGWTFAESDPDFDYTVAEADAHAAAVITANGGTVMMGPTDVGQHGRMCVAIDPAGAVFGVWQAREMIGAEIVNEPGGITWEDLRSTDPDAARAFYRAVFGYRAEAMPMAPDDYTTLHLADEEAPLGGLGGMMGAPDGTPSHWLVYFAVADCDAALAAAVGAGGTVLGDPVDTPFGRMAPLTDPWGAVFWVVQLPEGVEAHDRSD